VLVAEDCLIDLLLDQLRASDLDLPHHDADHAPSMRQVVLRSTRTHVGASTILQVLIVKQRGMFRGGRKNELLRLHTLEAGGGLEEASRFVGIGPRMMLGEHLLEGFPARELVL
jgi:hypothetical protein